MQSWRVAVWGPGRGGEFTPWQRRKLNVYWGQERNNAQPATALYSLASGCTVNKRQKRACDDKSNISFYDFFKNIQVSKKSSEPVQSPSAKLAFMVSVS